MAHMEVKLTLPGAKVRIGGRRLCQGWFQGEGFRV